MKSDLHQVCGFLRVLGTPFSSTNKTNRHGITEILLKVALYTISLTLNKSLYSLLLHWINYLPPDKISNFWWIFIIPHEYYIQENLLSK